MARKEHPARAALKYRPECRCCHCRIAEAIGKILDTGLDDDVFLGLAHGLALMLAYAPSTRKGQQQAAFFDECVDALMYTYMAERAGVDIDGPPANHLPV